MGVTVSSYLVENFVDLLQRNAGKGLVLLERENNFYLDTLYFKDLIQSFNV